MHFITSHRYFSRVIIYFLSFSVAWFEMCMIIHSSVCNFIEKYIVYIQFPHIAVKYKTILTRTLHFCARRFSFLNVCKLFRPNDEIWFSQKSKTYSYYTLFLNRSVFFSLRIRAASLYFLLLFLKIICFTKNVFSHVPKKYFIQE